jgi:hypothetical protein
MGGSFASSATTSSSYLRDKGAMRGACQDGHDGNHSRLEAALQADDNINTDSCSGRTAVERHLKRSSRPNADTPVVWSAPNACRPPP